MAGGGRTIQAEAVVTCKGGTCGKTGEGKCFVAGTPIWTQHGTKAIENIKVGDIVLSRDEAGQMTRFAKVDAVFVRKALVLKLVLEDDNGQIETIGTTVDHPFHVPGKGFVRAGDLKPGLTISTAENWKNITIHSVSTNHSIKNGFLHVKSVNVGNETTTVYNFSVPETRTYFVGKFKAWVHNNDACTFSNALPEKLAEELALAERLGVHPVKPGTSAFDDIINNSAGESIKWAITQEGKLVVMPKIVSGTELSHPVLSGGKPVLAAGEASIAGSKGTYFGLEITNHSGHFKPSLESLGLGKKLFEEYGITF